MIISGRQLDLRIVGKQETCNSDIYVTEHDFHPAIIAVLQVRRILHKQRRTFHEVAGMNNYLSYGLPAFFASFGLICESFFGK